MKLRIFEDPVLFRLGPIPVTETMVTSVAVSVLLVVAAVVIRTAVVRGSDNWLATVGLLTVEWIDGLVKDIVGHEHAPLATFAGSLFLFIAGCNLAGQLPGTHPVTASVVATSALAVVVFLAVPIAGMHSRGLWSYLTRYFRPNPLFLPLHVISELSRTLALSVRLFGNVMSGHLVVSLLVALAGFLVPTPMMALEVLIGLLQAYIFTVLSIVYIGAAITVGEEL